MESLTGFTRLRQVPILLFRIRGQSSTSLLVGAGLVEVVQALAVVLAVFFPVLQRLSSGLIVS